jgi:hypothetical protein
MTELVDMDDLLFLTLAVSYFTRKINVAYRKDAGIYIVIDAAFITHDVIGIIHTDLVDRLPLPDQRRDDIVQALKFFLRQIDSDPAVSAVHLISFLGFFGIVGLLSQCAGTDRLTAVAHVRWLAKGPAFFLNKIRTGIIAPATHGTITFTIVIRVRWKKAFYADLPLQGTDFPSHTRIKRS